MEKEITLRVKKQYNSVCLYDWEAEIRDECYSGTAMVMPTSNVSIEWYDKYLPNEWEEIEKLIEQEL